MIYCKGTISRLLVVLIFMFRNAHFVTCENNYAEQDTCAAELNPNDQHFPGCRLYIAKSTLNNETSMRLGLFTGKKIKRGHPIAPPDIMIQLIDYLPSLSDFVSLYSFEPGQFGAQFEAKSVASVLPGVPSVAQMTISTSPIKANAVPFGIDIDEADVPRTTSPGAGASTHYHNFTFYARQDLNEGSEIFIALEEKEPWFEKKTKLVQSRDDSIQFKADFKPQRKLDWLISNGICVSNMIPKKSKIEGAGRGAFASTMIRKGSVIAISPVLPIKRECAMTKRMKVSGKVRTSRPQQLINYCFALTGENDTNSSSDVLFFPTAPMVNLINHGGNDANVKVQLSQNTKKRYTNLSSSSIEEISTKNEDIIIEYVATKDIYIGDEITSDYGQHWTNAWKKHVTEWKPPLNSHLYSPSYVMDDVAGLLRNEKEQKDHPYPANVLTGCYYRYSTHVTQDGIAGKPKKTGEASIIKWKMDRRTFDYRNLRPCNIMHREKDENGQIMYTAMMRNSNSMREDEMIPKGEMHVVNYIPRNAIKFLDKMYSTDMHLPNAFRHEILLSEDL